MVLASEASAKMHVRTEKKKAHLRIAKPGEVTVAARHAAPWMASTLPRAIRNRSSRPKPGKLSPVAPGSPQQEQVVNVVTGKRALGPWSGPFKSHPDSTLTDMMLPETIFMDTRGAAHLGLDAEEHQKLLRALQEAQEGGASVNPPRMDLVAVKTDGQLIDINRALVKRQHELESLSRASCKKLPSRRQQRALLKRDNQINQPRRFYCSNLILKNAKKELGMVPTQK